MVVTFLVACDLFGEKQNTAFEFSSIPTVAELVRLVEQHYDQECTMRRPALMPNIPFKIAALQVYSELEGRWTDVKSPSQLSDRCQLYAFQKDHGLHADKQGTIPPARFTVSGRTQQGQQVSSTTREGGTSALPNASSRTGSTAITPGGGSGTPNVMFTNTNTSSVSAGGGAGAGVGGLGGGVPLSLDQQERVRNVFEMIDTNRNSTIEFTELKMGLSSINIELSSDILEGIFGLADQNRDGVISLSEWQTFTRNHATALVEALYHRLTARDVIQKSRDEARALEERLAQRRQREAELRQQLAEVQREVQMIESQFRDADNILKQREDQRRRIEDAERQLIQREVDILSRRIMLIKEEQVLREDVRSFYESPQMSHATSPRRMSGLGNR